MPQIRILKNGRYKAEYSKEKLNFIKDNYRDMTDREFAKNFKVSLSTITNWRVHRLGLMKIVVRPENKSFFIRAKRELEALSSYKYKGIMQESVDRRIEFLKVIVFGK